MQAGRLARAKAVTAIVFGSDQGLVGQFNDVLADFVAKALSRSRAKKESGPSANAFNRGWRMPVSPVGLFAVPTSVNAITPFVGQILVEIEAHHGRARGFNFTSSTIAPGPARPRSRQSATATP